nr:MULTISPECIES: ABC-F family ATP-binding cassette domain-containing protein [unclassified Brevibacterium]
MFKGSTVPTSSLHAHARSSAQLIATDVSVIRGATPILNHVDLNLSPTSRVAMVGENGRGKSTLLHVLAGDLAPDAGTVDRIGTIAVAEQEFDATDGRTVGQVVAEAIAESLAALAELDAASGALAGGAETAVQRYTAALERAEALDAWDAERRVRIALDALQADSDMARPLAELSVGQRYRVRLACLLGTETDFLLLDEPTNHLDRGGLEFLTAQLRSRSGGVAVVTHDRALLADFAETVVDLDPTPDGRPAIYGSGYEGYRTGRIALRERWEQEYERQRAERGRLQDSLSSAQNRLVSGWRPDKGTNKHGRATRAGGLVQSVHRRQAALEAHAITVPQPPQVFHFPELHVRAGASLLTVDQVGVSGRLAGPVSFSLSQHGRLAVLGPNGAGKSTLLRVCAGDLAPDTGSARLSGGTRLGFLHQESALPGQLRASELYASRLAALLADGVLPQAEAIGLSQLGLLKPGESGKRVAELSMGQQRRLELALVLARRPHVLLLDEPSNHLSIALVDELTEALGATGAAVVMSTHDRQLRRDISDWPSIEVATPAALR